MSNLGTSTPPSSVDVAAGIERRLLDDIIVGRRLPKAALVVDELGASLDVPEQVVRTAVDRLVTGGLATIDEDGTVRVRRWSRADGEDVFAIRRRLEGLAARLCAERATEAQRQAIVTANERFVDTLLANNVAANVRADMAFHAAIVAGAASPELDRLYRASPALGCSMVVVGRSLPEPVDRVMGPHVRACHDPIIAAIVARDPDAAARAADHHGAVASQRAFGEAP